MECCKSHLVKKSKLLVSFPRNIVYPGIHGKFVDIWHVLVCHVKNHAQLFIVQNKRIFPEQKKPEGIRPELSQDLHVTADSFQGMDMERIFSKVAEAAFGVAAPKSHLQSGAFLFAWRQIDCVMGIDRSK